MKYFGVVVALLPRVALAQAALDPNEHGHGHVHPHPHEPGDHHHHPHAHPHPDAAGHHPAEATAAGVGTQAVPAATGALTPAVAVPLAITGFSPTEGPSGTRVVVSGTGFLPSARVWMAGHPLKTESQGREQITVVIPLRAQSDVLLVRQPGYSDAKAAAPFVVVRPPLVRAFAPKAAPADARIEIYGAGFRDGDAVLFAGKALTVVETKPDRLTVIVPAGPAKDRFIVQRGALSVAAKQAFAALPPGAAITGFSPRWGAPGATVRVTGRNFAPEYPVLLAGQGQKVLGRGPEFIEFQVAPNAKSGEILVRSAHGGSARTEAIFEVARTPAISGFTPPYAPVGSRVEIRGKNFLTVDQVLLGETVLRVAGVGPGFIEVDVMEGAQTGPFVVRRGEQTARSKRVFEVLYAPEIAGFEPPSGGPGTPVTIRGRHFTGDAKVLFGSSPLKVASRGANGDTLGIVIQAGQPSARFVVVTRGGQATSTGVFEVMTYAEIAGFSPAFGPPGTRVTIKGRDFSGQDKVFLGTVPAPIVASSSTELIVTVPEGARPDRFNVESHGRLVSSKQIFRVVAPPPPLAMIMNPMSGPPGTEVILSIGRAFRPDDQIHFGGKLLPKRVLPGSMEARVRIPPDAATDHFEVVIGGGRERVRADRPFEVIGSGKPSTGPQPGIY